MVVANSGSLLWIRHIKWRSWMFKLKVKWVHSCDEHWTAWTAILKLLVLRIRPFEISQVHMTTLKYSMQIPNIEIKSSIGEEALAFPSDDICLFRVEAGTQEVSDFVKPITSRNPFARCFLIWRH